MVSDSGGVTDSQDNCYPNIDQTDLAARGIRKNHNAVLAMLPWTSSSFRYISSGKYNHLAFDNLVEGILKGVGGI